MVLSRGGMVSPQGKMVLSWGGMVSPQGEMVLSRGEMISAHLPQFNFSDFSMKLTFPLFPC
jgi:hypothetical protein